MSRIKKAPSNKLVILIYPATGRNDTNANNKTNPNETPTSPTR